MAKKFSQDASHFVSKYRGCLVGALIGDCLGANFEGFQVVPSGKLFKYIDSLKSKECRIQEFTDDTAMTRSVAESLIHNKKYVAQDMAERFCDEYYKEPDRGYGKNVTTIFEAIHGKKYSDIYEASRQQFSGLGSYGNGSAMRIAPVALFGYHNFEQMVEIARLSSLLTHANVVGYNGAILQCLAIYEALTLDSSYELNVDNFLDSILEKMKVIERIENEIDPLQHPFCHQLLQISELLKKEKLDRARVVDVLGNDISALKSVPTAIFSFLKSVKPNREYPNHNHFERTILYAIQLGGDTDTIASMAGAISGAYYGLEYIPKLWQEKCEGLETAIRQADNLLNLQIT